MKLVVFGGSISSAWGHGQATRWRGLVRALDELGHEVVFFERHAPEHARHRDLDRLPGRGRLVLYRELDEIEREVRVQLRECDVAIVASDSPDRRAAGPRVLGAAAVRAYYELDASARLERGGRDELLGEFDLVLSDAGGAVLDALRSQLGAARIAPLYGSVDPDLHRPAVRRDEFRADCSYLGPCDAARRDALDALFVAPARARPDLVFALGGGADPEIRLSSNVRHVAHVAPADHAAFYASSRVTISVTPEPLRSLGWCPPHRLFEAAACGTVVLTDEFAGLDAFYSPGSEILIAEDGDDAIGAIERPEEELRRVARRARERTLDQHTARHRARELCALLDAARRPAERARASADARV